MTAYQKLLLVYELIGKLIESEYDIMIRDQLQLNAYAKKNNARKDLIDVTQLKLNERFDNFENLKNLYGQIPDLVESTIRDFQSETGRLKDAELKKKDELITSMARFEMDLIIPVIEKKYGKMNAVVKDGKLNINYQATK